MCWYSSIIELKNARWDIEKEEEIVRAGLKYSRKLNRTIYMQKKNPLRTNA